MRSPRQPPIPVGRQHTPSPAPIEPVLRISTGVSGLPVETPVEIEVNGQPVATLVCTPESLEELVIGWLFGQGFIDAVSDISRVQIRGGRAVIMLKRALPGGHDWKEQLAAGFDASHVRQPGAARTTPPPRDQYILEARFVLAVLAEIFERFDADPQDRSLHHAGASDGQAVLVNVHDIGRHNALDKLIGWSVLTGEPLGPFVVALSGRVNASMVHRAIRAGIRILATDTVPSAQAVRMAQGGGIALIGDARNSQRTIYTHPWRIERSAT